jgi:hypothetical protein
MPTEHLYVLHDSQNTIINQLMFVMFRTVFWVILPCRIPEDSSEHHTRRRENLKSHDVCNVNVLFPLQQEINL